MNSEHNAYAPPLTDVHDAAPGGEMESGRRPLLVWLIAVLYWLSPVGTSLRIMLTVGSYIQEHPGIRVQFDTLGVVQAVLMQLLNVTAAVGLFRMRRWSAYLFTAALVWSLSNWTWQSISVGLPVTNSYD